MTDRIQGIVEGLQRELPDVTSTRLDTSGNPVRIEGLLGKFLRAQTGRKVLVAALDDATALAAKTAIEVAGRLGDCIIVSHGVDHSVHGGASRQEGTRSEQSREHPPGIGCLLPRQVRLRSAADCAADARR